MRLSDDYQTLTGYEKAAVLLLSVGDAYSAKLFASLEEDEIRMISQSMSELGAVSSVIVEQLFVEFTEQVATTGDLVKTPDITERILRKVREENPGDEAMEQIASYEGHSMWEKLSNVSEQQLANYLKNEYPQTIAVVMAKLKPQHAAKVMEFLPETLSMEVIERMLDLESVKKEVFDDVEETLHREFISTLSRQDTRDSHEAVAEIINGMDRSTEAKLMNMLEETDSGAADKIRALMFTFEDLANINAAGIQTLVRSVDKKRLIIALKGASEKVRWAFFENMSERAEKLIHEDMHHLGPIRLREVDEAQAEILEIAKDLASRGEIMIGTSINDNKTIY
jgi:flagellar motor switch protein FliG